MNPRRADDERWGIDVKVRPSGPGCVECEETSSRWLVQPTPGPEGRVPPGRHDLLHTH